MNITYQRCNKNEGWKFVERWLQSPDIMLGMLFAGDRWSCVDRVILARDGDTDVGIATLSLRGEMGTGGKSIVAVYVSPSYRRCGIARQLIIEGGHWLHT